MEQKVLRVSTFVVVSALLLRLLSGFLPVLSSEAVSVMLFLQTGRLVRPGNILFTPGATEPPVPTDPPNEPTQSENQNPQEDLPVFPPKMRH